MNLNEKLTHNLRESLDQAAALALHAQNPEIGIAHILWALLTDSQSILNVALSRCNVDKAPLELVAKSLVEKNPKSATQTKTICISARSSTMPSSQQTRSRCKMATSLSPSICCCSR